MNKNQEPRTDFTRLGLLDRAAYYFFQARKPRVEWKCLEDLSAQLAEFDLRYEASEYDNAASVLIEIDFDYLLLWGHYRLLIEMHQKLQGKIMDPTLERICTGNLGLALRYIGQVNKSIKYFQKALESAMVQANRQAEAIWRGYLGNANADLGETRKAIEFYEQALVIAREIGDRRGEGNHCGNLGNAYADLGETRKAIEFYEQALVIAREIGDRRDEGNWLGSLGNRYLDLGEHQKAIAHYEQSIIIRREIGNKSGEATDLTNIADAFLVIAEYVKAKETYTTAIQISDEIMSAALQNIARCGLTQACLFQNDLPNARVNIEVAQQYDVPMNNHNASALHGIIALRQGDEVAARDAFARAILQADELLSKTTEYYKALDAKGLALSGLAILDDDGSGGQPSTLTEAIEMFKKARKIAPHAGVVKSVLRLFDELAKCDQGGVLKEVRKVIEGS